MASDGWLEQAQPCVGGHHPDPAVCLLRQPGAWRRSGECLLDEAETLLQAEAPRVGPPRTPRSGASGPTHHSQGERGW